MIKIFKDIYNFYLIKKDKSKLGFFCENENILEFIKPYIINKAKKKKLIIISFKKINFEYDNTTQYIFETKIFRELVFLTLNLRYLYSSTPELGSTLFKKSKTSKCKYIYLQHSLASLTMIYPKNAFNNFDAIQAVTNYQYKEIFELNKINRLKIRAFKSNYLFLKSKIKNFDKKKYKNVLIAPSWNTNFYKLNCHKILSNYLNEKKISYDLRPHPMSIIKKEVSLEELNNLNITCNTDTDLNFFDYQYFISDWSGIFIEFAIILKKNLF